MLIKNEKMIKKIFDRVYGIACYGEHFDDRNNLEIPYEFEENGNISDINDKIYNLRCKIAGEYTGNENCDIDNYEDLRKLEFLYECLMKEFCYKMFFYGYTLNLENSKNSKK